MLLASQADQSASILLNLPTELIIYIYHTVSHAPTQVLLALTCKLLSSLVSTTPLTRAYTSPKYAGLIPKEVFDVPPLMRSLTTWMPTHLRLCDHCLTFRPVCNEYWTEVDGCENGGFWIQKVGWEFAGGSWHKQMHNICPMCHLSCSLSDYVECDGCRALGRLGDIDWARVSGMQRRVEVETRAGRFAT